MLFNNFTQNVTQDFIIQLLLTEHDWTYNVPTK